jgi:hypothetical protein
MARESYDDLIFQLGDLAREHLAEAKHPPRAMEAVFAAEDEVLAIREEIAATEAELNEEDAAYADFLSQQDADRERQQTIIKRWRAAVAGVEVRSRDLKKKLSSLKAAFRYQQVSLSRQEAKHEDLELREGHDPQKIAVSRENLKKARLHIMREQRHLEELEWEFNQVLTPRPGQQGAQGILAHKRVLEMEDEAEERKLEHDERMKALDAALAQKDEELKAAEEELDGRLFELGEECYGERTPHPELNPLYPRLDKAR